MNVRCKTVDNMAVISLYGELNEASAEDIKQYIDGIINEGNFTAMILDFANVSFMNSTGVGIVLSRYQKLKSKGRSMCIANPSRQIDKILRLSGVYSVMDRICYEV